MILTCPSCATKYRIPDEKLSPTGTKVRCSRCREVFVGYPPEIPISLDVELPPKVEAPQPAEQPHAPDAGLFSQALGLGSGMPAAPQEAPAAKAPDAPLPEDDLFAGLSAGGPATEAGEQLDFGRFLKPEAGSPAAEPPAAKGAETLGRDEREERLTAAFEDREDIFGALEAEAAKAPAQDEPFGLSPSAVPPDEPQAPAAEEPAWPETPPFAPGGGHAEPDDEAAEGRAAAAAAPFGAPAQAPVAEEPVEPEGAPTAMPFEEEPELGEPPAEPFAAAMGAAGFEADEAGLDMQAAPAAAAADEPAPAPAAAPVPERTEAADLGPAVGPLLEELEAAEEAPAGPGLAARLVTGVIIAGLLALLAGGGLVVLRLWKPDVQLPAGIASVIDGLLSRVAPKQEAPAPASADEQVKQIALENVRQYTVPNDKAGMVLVVEGKAVNRFANPKQRVKIEVALYDAQGAVVARQEALCGNTVSLFQLQIMSQAELEAALSAEVGIQSNNTNLRTGENVPFMVVFFNPPETVTEFGVKVIEAKDAK